MQTTLIAPEVQTLKEPAPHRIYITRAMCRSLEDSGLLTGRYELIDGEIISKMGQNRPHAIAVMLITEWLIRVFGEGHIQCQLPIDVAAPDNEMNEPEPDVSVLAQPVAAYRENNPGPADVLLLVEVSNTTLRFDLNTKALLYARAGIADYWVADVVGRRFVVHRIPTPTGYEEITGYHAEDTIAPLARPEVAARVSDLLPAHPQKVE